MKTWTCGDCHAVYPKTQDHCSRPFDDYLSLRGGTIESAITGAVEVAIAPLVKDAEDRLSGVTKVRWRSVVGGFGVTWTWMRHELV